MTNWTRYITAIVFIHINSDLHHEKICGHRSEDDATRNVRVIRAGVGRRRRRRRWGRRAGGARRAGGGAGSRADRDGQLLALQAVRVEGAYEVSGPRGVEGVVHRRSRQEIDRRAGVAAVEVRLRDDGYVMLAGDEVEDCISN